MGDEKYMISEEEIAQALDDGILDPDDEELKNYSQSRRDKGKADGERTAVGGFDPAPIRTSMADYNLIVPANPEKPDGKKDYNMQEYVNWMLDSGIVCTYRDKHRYWMIFDGRVYVPITEAEIKQMITASTDIVGADGHIMGTAIKYDRNRMATLIEYISLKLMDIFDGMEE